MEVLGSFLIILFKARSAVALRDAVTVTYNIFLVVEMALDGIGSASSTATVYCVFNLTLPNALSLAQPPCALIREQHHRSPQLSQFPVHPPGPSSPLLRCQRTSA
jgi:hypothetical protein